MQGGTVVGMAAIGDKKSKSPQPIQKVTVVQIELVFQHIMSAVSIQYDIINIWQILSSYED